MEACYKDDYFMAKIRVCYVMCVIQDATLKLITPRVRVDCSMATRSDEVILQRDERKSAAADAVSSLYTPFQTLTALAVETGQAVRQTFGESEVVTSGHVEEGSQHDALPNSDDRSHHQTEPEALFADGQVNAAQRRDNSSPVGVDPEVVRAEIDRVQSKTLSTNAATEVILRFNFMGGRESKVRNSCLAVAATKTNFRRIYLGVIAGCIALCGTFNTCRSCCFDNRVCPQNGTGLHCSLHCLPPERCPLIFEAPFMTCSQSLFDLTLQIHKCCRATEQQRSNNTEQHGCGMLPLAAYVFCWLVFFWAASYGVC